MLLPVRVMEAIGGFAAVRNLLAEDQAIGLRVRKAGYSIRLSHHVIENVNEARSFRWFLNRHSRWYKIRRRMALPAFLVEPFSNLATIGLVWALSGDSGIAWGGLLVLVGLGVAPRRLPDDAGFAGRSPNSGTCCSARSKDLFLLADLVRRPGDRAGQLARAPLPVGRFTRLRSERVPKTVRRRVPDASVGFAPDGNPGMCPFPAFSRSAGAPRWPPNRPPHPRRSRPRSR